MVLTQDHGEVGPDQGPDGVNCKNRKSLFSVLIEGLATTQESNILQKVELDDGEGQQIQDMAGPDGDADMAVECRATHLAADPIDEVADLSAFVVADLIARTLLLLV